jgi:alkanesulfonate monooxygenase SsuD/methylene tetrahydromethanopterin reductase-like flavin-dependent oxidoreductase (luciferase family)
MRTSRQEEHASARDQRAVLILGEQVKFSTFHAFMLGDVKGVAGDHLLEGQRIGGTHRAAIADELTLIRAADELGFDTCWLREHHFTDYGFLPNTMTMAAHVAGVTERIRIGTAVITLPLHHPVRVAEEVALVDVLSGGRVDVGIGRGYQSIEFDAFGVPLAQARSRTDEAIRLLRALWTEDAVHHQGTWPLDGVRLQPRPVQAPHPPLYYASVNSDSIIHYAKQGIPFIVDSTVQTSQLAVLADTWRDVARAHGHPADDAELVAVRYVWLDDTDDAARDYVASTPKVTSLATDSRIRPVDKDGNIAAGYEYWDKGWHGRDLAYYSHDLDWNDRWIAGTPDRIVEQLRHLGDIGIRNVCCVFGLSATPPSTDDVRARMARFARDVMPAFQPAGRRPGSAS